MDGIDWIKRIPKTLIKYKYVLVILAVGVIFMLIPSREKEDTVTETKVVMQSESLEERLETILSKISGAGEVSVLLSEATGDEYVYQNNADTQKDSSGESSRTDTVIITDSGRNEQGLIKQVNPPKYNGAIILCQGADDPVVRLSVVEAVSNVTGLGADKITVLKMK